MLESVDSIKIYRCCLLQLLDACHLLKLVIGGKSGLSTVSRADLSAEGDMHPMSSDLSAKLYYVFVHSNYFLYGV